MKKFILVMVFVLLTALFIAFNYLLWERESRDKELKNLEYANASNNASISAQKREIDSLEEENKNLEDQLDQLGEEKDQILQDKTAVESQRDEAARSLQDKINFINSVKLYTDIKVLAKPIVDWTDAVNQGKYDEAYELEYADVLLKDRPVSQKVYTDEMKNTVRKIEIVEVKLDKDRGSDQGDIILEAMLNVKLVEDSDKKSSQFTEGENRKYIKIVYSYEKEEFIISNLNIS